MRILTLTLIVAPTSYEAIHRETAILSIAQSPW